MSGRTRKSPTFQGEIVANELLPNPPSLQHHLANVGRGPEFLSRKKDAKPETEDKR
jgi:hypothetical protein